MITLESIYVLAGALFGAYAVFSAFDHANPKRFGNAGFWGLLATSFLFGSHLSDLANGVIVLGLIVLGGFGFLGIGKPRTTTLEERRAAAQHYGNTLFLPALLIPAVTLAGTFLFKDVRLDGAPLVDPKQVTVISLVLGTVAALASAMVWLKAPPSVPIEEGRRLADTIGWAMVLPQMLASLGAIFDLAGVGRDVGVIASEYLRLDTSALAVIVYCVGMAVFTAVMGNAFGAFPVMTAAVGLPLVVHKFGGDPAVVAAIGMLSGFCGTLVTPMAANFNIVPAALLELPDRYGVIKAQIPTAILLLLINMALMYFLAFHFGGRHV